MKQSFKAIDITLIALFAALMAIGANVTSYITVGAVPLSLQPFFAVLAGALLGRKRGAIAMIIYLLIGLIGVPVFAQFDAGVKAIIGPTGGFILAFPFVSYFTGLIIEKGNSNKLMTFMVASFVGLIITYVIGTTHLWLSLNYVIGKEMSYTAAWIGMASFIPKDIIFTILAGVLSPRIYRAMNHSKAISFS
ncbi:biotin transporter BioY [Massilibacterium senegalense]|uniref:biotin transporter BioY n=1 Tax=Massilibacterium senegalense TaxID=1632858 RepID=UPI000AD7D42A|nr:biotin transporter BioY [Massilibacterium senegalense]